MKISRIWHRSHGAGEHAPRVIDWSRLSDGRPRRLERDVHFLGSAQSFVSVVRDAAAAMGKSALVVPERLQPEKSLWIQFADGEIVTGDPCPCGGCRLERVGGRILRCDACRRTLIARDVSRARGVRGVNIGGNATARSGAGLAWDDGELWDTSPEQTEAVLAPEEAECGAPTGPTLSGYKAVRLVPWGRSRFVGVGIDANGTETLLIARRGPHGDVPRLPVDDLRDSRTLEVVFSLPDPWERLSAQLKNEQGETI